MAGQFPAWCSATVGLFAKRSVSIKKDTLHVILVITDHIYDMQFQNFELNGMGTNEASDIATARFILPIIVYLF